MKNNLKAFRRLELAHGQVPKGDLIRFYRGYTKPNIGYIITTTFYLALVILIKSAIFKGFSEVFILTLGKKNYFVETTAKISLCEVLGRHNVTANCLTGVFWFMMAFTWFMIIIFYRSST